MACSGWISTTSGRPLVFESHNTTTSDFCSSAREINPCRRAGESSKATNATLRAEAGMANPCPSGPRKLRDTPGIQKTGKGAAAINPFAVERLKKTESAIGESEAGAWARRYCPGAGINSGGQSICAEPSKKTSLMMPVPCFIGEILTCFKGQSKRVIITK